MDGRTKKTRDVREKKKERRTLRKKSSSGPNLLGEPLSFSLSLRVCVSSAPRAGKPFDFCPHVEKEEEEEEEEGGVSGYPLTHP